jgi:hypothetical protein
MPHSFLAADVCLHRHDQDPVAQTFINVRQTRTSLNLQMSLVEALGPVDVRHWNGDDL